MRLSTWPEAINDTTSKPKSKWEWHEKENGTKSQIYRWYALMSKNQEYNGEKRKEKLSHKFADNSCVLDFVDQIKSCLTLDQKYNFKPSFFPSSFFVFHRCWGSKLIDRPFYLSILLPSCWKQIYPAALWNLVSLIQLPTSTIRNNNSNRSLCLSLSLNDIEKKISNYECMGR